MKHTKIIILTLAATFSIQLFAMQPEQPAPNMVTLVSTDGKEFQIPLNVAQESGTLNSLLTIGISEAAERKFPLEFSSNVINEVIALMQVLHKNRYLKNHKKALLDALDPYLANEILLNPAFTKAIDFLDIPIIKDLIARTFAKRLLSKQLSFEQIEQIVKSAMGQESAGILLNNSARHYFLLTGKKILNIPESTYRFSIQDYLDYKPEEFRTRMTGDKINLWNLSLNSLEGLQNLPGIQNITQLDLSNNYLQSIKPHSFAGLNKLEELYLDRNPLQSIEPEAFAGLPNLYLLALNNGELSHLNPGTFAQLPHLRTLYLNANHLKDIQPVVLAGLPELEALYLGGNKIDRTKQAELNAALPRVRIVF